MGGRCVAVEPDGSLLISDDGEKLIWRVSYNNPIAPGPDGIGIRGKVASYVGYLIVDVVLKSRLSSGPSHCGDPTHRRFLGSSN